MNTHKNARLTPHGRALLAARVIDEGLRGPGRWFKPRVSA